MLKFLFRFETYSTLKSDTLYEKPAPTPPFRTYIFVAIAFAVCPSFCLHKSKQQGEKEKWSKKVRCLKSNRKELNCCFRQVKVTI